MKRVKYIALGPFPPTALSVPGFSLGTYVQDLIDEFHIRRVESVVMGVKEEVGKLGGRRRHQWERKDDPISQFSNCSVSLSPSVLCVTFLNPN